jgi:hypothetical protein
VGRSLQRLVLILVTGMLLCTSTYAAGPWSGQLRGGGTVRVDPQTNRATVVEHGIRTQLWDGVHHLEDGSTITVQSGQVVPTKEILHAREPGSEEVPSRGEWEGAVIVGYSPCEKLKRRVCGAADECRKTEPCDLAGQLLNMENEEREESGQPRLMTYTSGQCQSLMSDPDFPSCSTRGPAGTDSRDK